MSQNQKNFSSYTVLDSSPATGENAIAKNFMSNVFVWMFVALGVSALFAYLFATNETLMNLLYAPNDRGGMSLSGLGFVVAFAPLGFVLIMSLGYQRFSAAALTLLFLAFSAVMGMSLSSVLLVYTASSVVGCFVTAAVMFGVMAVLGYTTKQDLTSFGKILMMGLIGIIVATIINIFMHSSGLNLLISVIGVAIFTGLTAYDVQKLKRIGAGLEYGEVSADETNKLAIMGAMSIYLDFINIFLFLLELFGKGKD